MFQSHDLLAQVDVMSEALVTGKQVGTHGIRFYEHLNGIRHILSSPSCHRHWQLDPSSLDALKTITVATVSPKWLMEDCRVAKVIRKEL